MLDNGRPDAQSSATDDGLRVLDWNDLRARLDAARDLRAELSQQDCLHPASFDAGSARHIAALQSRPESTKERHVNLDVLGNSKGQRCNGDPSQDFNDQADRGK